VLAPAVKLVIFLAGNITNNTNLIKPCKIMKKNLSKHTFYRDKEWLKTLLIMKNSLLIFLITLVQVSASVSTHGQNLTLMSENRTVREVFRDIEKGTNYRFFYNEEFRDLSKVLTLNIMNHEIKEVLDIMLANSDVTYKILDNDLIVITPSEVSQQLKVAGRITDANTGEGLPGVNIMIEGTTTGVVSNLDGYYEISVPDANSVLVFSYVGYSTARTIVGERTQINVGLNPDYAALDEVVVVGYGTQKRVNITGSVATLDIERIQNRPMTDASHTLRGIPGVYVRQNTGAPGRDDATIRIRGVGTLNHVAPLVLYDGVEFSLQDINPNDIESISVLKDAASTAIYGSRAANGVILITSKRGQRDRPFTVNYINTFGIEEPTFLPDIVWDPVVYLEHKNIALQNQGLPIETSVAAIEEYRQGVATNRFTYPSTNWYDEILRTGSRQEHHISLSGGGSNHNLNLSLGYMDQNGILNNISANRYTVGINASVDVTNWITLGARLSGTYRTFNEPFNSMDTYWNRVYRSLPVYAVRLEDGNYGNSWIRTLGHNVFANPVAWLMEGNNDFTQQRLLTQVNADVKLPFNLKYSVNAGVNKYDAKQERMVPMLTQVHPKTGEVQIASQYAQGYRYYNDQLNLTFYNTLGWSQSISDHNVDLLAGSSFEQFNSSNFNATERGALDNVLTDLNVFSENPQVGGSSSGSALIGYFGRLNYNYDERYLLEVNFRYDGSSRFARGNRWGFFPSVSFGWRIDQEQFLADVPWIYQLRPRFSYGTIGNQQIALFSYVNAVTLGHMGIIGGTPVSGAAVTAASNPDVSWESTTITNLGLDIGLFEGKWNFVLDIYNKDTRDILRPVNLPSQVGDWTGPMKNIGQVNNKGFEISSFHRNVIGNFRYDIGGDFAYNKNKVINLNGQTIISGRYIIKEGYPIDSYFLLESDGLFQTQEEVAAHAFQDANTKPGYVRYVDQNGDGRIDGDDRVIIDASVIPQMTYGFNFNLGYSNFNLSAFFEGVSRVYSFPVHNITYPFMNGAGFTKEWMTDAWTPENPNARLPILTTATGYTGNFRDSDFWLQDASYLRIKNLQLSYTVPSSLVQRANIRQMRVYANAQNWWTWTAMAQVDPERNHRATTMHHYPSVKTLTFGLNVSF
jgi:TonB-dependent starch-binding outer membrane protein SusC